MIRNYMDQRRMSQNEQLQLIGPNNSRSYTIINLCYQIKMYVCMYVLIFAALAGLDSTYSPTLAGHDALPGHTLGPDKFLVSNGVFKHK